MAVQKILKIQEIFKVFHELYKNSWFSMKYDDFTKKKKNEKGKRGKYGNKINL